MRSDAYEQYLREQDSWLHRGRRRLLRVMLETHRPRRRRALRLLELGAGSGKYAEEMAEFGRTDAIEMEPMAVERLKEFPFINQLYTQPIPIDLDQRYDFISAMDVLEHIEDDVEAFNWMAEHLAPGGVAFITMPAFSFLFSGHDVALGHHRRYRVGDLERFRGAGLRLVKRGYFNCALFPLVVASRMAGSLKPASGGAKKQSSTMPAPIDRLFYGVVRNEAEAIRRWPLFPWGLTMYAVYRKSRRRP